MTEPSKEVKAVWARTRELGQTLDEVNGRLETLEGQKLADNLAELSLVVKKLAEKPKSNNAPVWNWGTFNAQQQAQAWEILIEWVEGTFQARWPRSHKEMLGYSERHSSCWWKHPDMIESMTGLFATYHWAFTDKESGPLRVAEWLGRWLPDAVRQGKFIMEECKGTGYGPDGGHKTDLFDNKRVSEDNEELRAHIHMLKTGEVPS